MLILHCSLPLCQQLFLYLFSPLQWLKVSFVSLCGLFKLIFFNNVEFDFKGFDYKLRTYSRLLVLL